MIIIVQLFVRYFVINPLFSINFIAFAVGLPEFVSLILATASISAGGYIINDIFDRQADAMNKPTRILPSHGISLKTAWAWYAFLTGLGLILGLFLSLRIHQFNFWFVFVFSSGSLWFYSERLKHKILIGNVLIALLTALAVALPWGLEYFARMSEPALFVDGLRAYPLITLLIGAYVVFAFLLSWIRELLKDVEDMPGDIKMGSNTFPIVFGKVKSKIFAFVLSAFVFVLLLISAYYAYDNHMMNLLIYLCLLIAFYLFIAQNIFSADEQKDYVALSLYTKVFMLAGMLSMQILFLEL